MWFDSVAPTAKVTLLAAGGEDLTHGASLRRVPFAAPSPPSPHELAEARWAAMEKRTRGATASKVLTAAGVATDAARPAEDYHTFESGAYDLVVIINVLEHCRDALATLQVSGWGGYCRDFLLLPITSYCSCPCVDSRLTLRDINFRRLLPSPAVSQRQQPV